MDRVFKWTDGTIVLQLVCTSNKPPILIANHYECKIGVHHRRLVQPLHHLRDACQCWQSLNVRCEVLKSSHCFSQWGGVFPQKSSHCSPLKPTLTWQFSEGVIPQKFSHCSPLQPTLTWQFYSGGRGEIPQKSFHCSPLQPTLT